MRRLTPALVLALLALFVATGACSGSDGAAPTTTSSTTPTTTAADPAIDALLLDLGALPPQFTISEAVDDTITAFCATEDAAAGLQASARSVRGFQRTGGGASVIQLAFRFRDDGASRFVAQAATALDRCSGVPDAKGLAFDYTPLSPALETLIAEAGDERVGRHGVNVGSGSLSINVVIVQRADVGELIAVLGLDLSREQLDALSETAFRAAIAKLIA